MPADAPVAIGLDLGTSSLKGVAVGPDGRVLAKATRSYPTRRPEPDAAEQDPDDWLRAVDAVVAELGEAVSASTWGAVGLSAMLPTLVLADPDGTPVHPAVTWEDGRAEAEGAAMADRFGATHLAEVTGQPVDGRYLLPMAARLRGAGTVGARLLGAKDWLVLRLTGTALTDPSTAAGYGCFRLDTGTWDPELLDAADGVAVPDVVPSDHAVPLLPEVADRWGCAPGTPLIVGAADSVLGAYGMGVREPGTTALIAGTSTVLLAPVERVDSAAPVIVTPTADAGLALEADLIATGSALAWLAGLLGTGSVDALLTLADAAELEHAPVVLPYLGPGEQGVLWDPALVGLTSGLTLRTTAGELGLGLLAGIVTESARAIDVLAGDRPGPIVASGSGASPVYLQRLADATGREVLAFDGERDHSAIGAALLAGRGVLGFAEGPTMTPSSAFVPRTGQRDRWRRRFAIHERARAALPTIHGGVER